MNTSDNPAYHEGYEQGSLARRRLRRSRSKSRRGQSAFTFLTARRRDEGNKVVLGDAFGTGMFGGIDSDLSTSI